MKKQIILAVVAFLEKCHFLKPIQIAKLKHYYKFGKFPDYANPRDLNEKLNWLKFYGDTSRWPELADKYRVREYVTQCGYGDILVPFIGKWDNVNDIDWDKLPQKFVLKMNNGSGDIFICNDKSSINIPQVCKKFEGFMHKKYGILTGEPHYGKIKPCIIAEVLLDVQAQSIKSSSLIDYKIWCFNSEPKYIWTCHNRNSLSTEVALFDTEWNYHPEYSVFTEHYKKSDILVPKPKNLSKMLEIASVLSKNFPILRVDLYEVDGKVYFGELTFTSLGGFMDYYTPEFLLKAGNMVNLNTESVKK